MIHTSMSTYNNTGTSFGSLNSSKTKSHENLLNSYSSSNSNQGSLDKNADKMMCDNFKYDPSSIVTITISVVGLTGSMREQEEELHSSNSIRSHGSGYEYSQNSLASWVPPGSGSGPSGVGGSGKSCLCSRFVRPWADDYRETDHTAVLSANDFSGRIINNDHFVYWGQVLIPLTSVGKAPTGIAAAGHDGSYSDHGYSPSHSRDPASAPGSLPATPEHDPTVPVSGGKGSGSAAPTAVLLRIVEQTEFVDDTTWRPFRSGKKSHDEAYSKRCCATKLTSEEKLAYVCKDQLGLEHEYEQSLFPGGKVEIDGFLICYDSSIPVWPNSISSTSPFHNNVHLDGATNQSTVNHRLTDAQTTLVRTVLTSAKKSKKPALLAITKTDILFENVSRSSDPLYDKKNHGSNFYYESSTPTHDATRSTKNAPTSHHHPRCGGEGGGRKVLDEILKDIRDNVLSQAGSGLTSSVPLVEVSARLNANVTSAFSALVSLVLKSRGLSIPPPQTSSSFTNNTASAPNTNITNLNSSSNPSLLNLLPEPVLWGGRRPPYPGPNFPHPSRLLTTGGNPETWHSCNTSHHPFVASHKTGYTGSNPVTPYGSAYKTFVKSHCRVPCYEQALEQVSVDRNNAEREIKARLALRVTRFEPYCALTKGKASNGQKGWRLFLSEENGLGFTSADPAFARAISTLGTGVCAELFAHHLKELKKARVRDATSAYLAHFDREVLKRSFPDMDSLNYDRRWESFVDLIRYKPELADNFVGPDNEEIDNDSHVLMIWARDVGSDEKAPCPELAQNGITKIPWSIMDTPGAQLCFENHVQHLVAEDNRLRLKREFRDLIDHTPHIVPGKAFDDAIIFFRGHECFDRLSILDRREIYDTHQVERTAEARRNFLELMLEESDTFDKIMTSRHSGAQGNGNNVPTRQPLDRDTGHRSNNSATLNQTDFRRIHEALKHELRYKVLDRLEQERTVLILQHLGFLQCPFKEHCPFQPACVDIISPKLLARSLPSIYQITHDFFQYYPGDTDSQLLEPLSYSDEASNSMSIHHAVQLDILVLGVPDLCQSFISDSREAFPGNLFCSDEGDVVHQLVFTTLDTHLNKSTLSTSTPARFHGIVGLLSTKVPSSSKHKVSDEKTCVKLMADLHTVNILPPMAKKDISSTFSSIVVVDYSPKQSSTTPSSHSPRSYNENVPKCVTNLVQKLKCPFILLPSPTATPTHNYLESFKPIPSAIITDLNRRRSFLASMVPLEFDDQHVNDYHRMSDRCDNYLLYDSNNLFKSSKHITNGDKYVVGENTNIIMSTSMTASTLYAPNLSYSMEEINILLCMQCGDAYNLDSLIYPLLIHQFVFSSPPPDHPGHLWRPNDRDIPSLTVEEFTGHGALSDKKFMVKVHISSYHTAGVIPECNLELQHRGPNTDTDSGIPHGFDGYILAYSVKRKASLAIMKTFLQNSVPSAKPALVMAVTEHCTFDVEGSPSRKFLTGGDSSDTTLLLSEGQSVAIERAGESGPASFITTATQPPFHTNTAVFSPFFRLAYEHKKNEMGDSFCDYDTTNEALEGSTCEDDRALNLATVLGTERTDDDTAAVCQKSKVYSTHDIKAQSLDGLEVEDITYYKHHVSSTIPDQPNILKPSQIKKNRMSHIFTINEVPDQPSFSAEVHHNLKHDHSKNEKAPRERKHKENGTSSSNQFISPQRRFEHGHYGDDESSVVGDVGSRVNKGHTRAHNLNPGKLDMNRFANFNEEVGIRRAFGTGYKSQLNNQSFPPHNKGKPQPNANLAGASGASKMAGPSDVSVLCSTMKGGLVLCAPLTSPENTSDLCTPSDETKALHPDHQRILHHPREQSPLRRQHKLPSNLPDIVKTVDPNTHCEYPPLVSPSSILGDKSFASKIEQLEKAKLTSHHPQQIQLTNDAPPPVSVHRISFMKKKKAQSQCKENGDASALQKQGYQTENGPEYPNPTAPKVSKGTSGSSRWKASLLRVSSGGSSNNCMSHRNGLHVTPSSKLGMRDMTKVGTPMPVALVRCLEYIESEGISCEGIYRVPGSRSHVDHLIEKLVEDENRSIAELDIPVNAVATSIKTFLTDSSVSILPPTIFKEVLRIGKMECKTQKINAWKGIMAKSDHANLNVQLIKHFIHHLHRISQFSDKNCMNSRNLAICWWPTLIRPDFTDYERMIAATKPLEEAIHVLVENYNAIFNFK